MNRPLIPVSRTILVLFVALLMTATIADAQTKVKPGFNLFSAQQDVEIGTTSAAEVERQLPLVRDRAVVAYVDQIGQRLAAQAGGPGFAYQFRVVNASDINAFALPGGFIYINRGIIENANNEGEVAGVIAHEIAHVSLRHGTHQASKAYATQAGLSILGGLIGERVDDSTATIINALGGFGMNALFLKFSRELETQADIRGAQILAASGYTPADMVSFFHSLEKKDTALKTSWLSSHPAPPDRIARIEREAQLLRVSTRPTQRVAELGSVQTQLRRLGAAPTMAQIASGQTPAGTGHGTHRGRRRRESVDEASKLHERSALLSHFLPGELAGAQAGSDRSRPGARRRNHADGRQNRDRLRGHPQSLRAVRQYVLQQQDVELSGRHLDPGRDERSARADQGGRSTSEGRSRIDEATSARQRSRAHGDSSRGQSADEAQ
jgi:beta-barrel assembly-enhancing protease